MTLPERWHRDHAACGGCGTVVRPHHSGGRCVDCVRGKPVAEPDAPPVDGKRCSGCDRHLAWRFFGRDRCAKDGHATRCKRCRRPIVAATRARRRERLRAERAAARAARPAPPPAAPPDPAVLRAYQAARMAEYRARHRDAINARQRAAYAARKAASRGASA